MVARLLCALVLLLIFVLPPPAIAQSGPVRWIYLNKFDAETLQSLRERIQPIDIVSPVNFTVQQNGDVTGTDRPEIRSIVRTSRAKLIPLVRNDDRYDSFTPVLSNPTLRTKVIDQLVKLTNEHGYDGLNVDFEAIQGSDRAGLTAFVAELAARFRPAGKLTTVAVAAKPRELTTGWAGAYDYAALGKVSDYVVLMTYAYRTVNDKPGSTAPLNWVQRTIEFAATQTGREKLLLGVALWGYDWSTSGGVAVSRTHAEIETFARRPGAVSGYAADDESAWVRYPDGGGERIVWYEDSRAITAKLKLMQSTRIAGWAAWRLGQEGPAAWGTLVGQPTAQPVVEPVSRPAPPAGALDWTIPGGRFFSQTGEPVPGGGRSGYPVVDDNDAAFWSEFQKFGLDGLGYPISQRFVWNGFVTQAFQKAILQWAPDRREANFVNVFDELSKAGRDNWLQSQRSTPRPIAGNFDDGKNWEQIVLSRVGLLDRAPHIKATYLSRPDPMRAFGLPTSAVEDNGNHLAVRLQRAVIQYWKQDVPWARAGSITVANGGDIAAESGLIPASARTPVR